MTEDQTKQKIKGIFLVVFPELKKSPFSFTKKQLDYRNWDSFAHMELVSKIEQTFSISLTLEDTVSIESAQDVVKLLQGKYK